MYASISKQMSNNATRWSQEPNSSVVESMGLNSYWPRPSNCRTYYQKNSNIKNNSDSTTCTMMQKKKKALSGQQSSKYHSQTIQLSHVYFRVSCVNNIQKKYINPSQLQYQLKLGGHTQYKIKWYNAILKLLHVQSAVPHDVSTMTFDETQWTRWFLSAKKDVVMLRNWGST